MDFDRIAKVYAQHRRVHEGVLRYLMEIPGLTAGSRVLEVGCGTGNYIGAIRAAVGCECSGADPSARMLESAVEIEGLTVRTGTAEHLPFTDGSFDLVYSVDVIHHVGDRNAYMAEAYRVLDRGGLLCTVTESGWIIRHREILSRYFPETVDVDLERYPRIAALTDGMRLAGFAGIEETAVETQSCLQDVAPLRAKAFSCLHLISEEAFQRGLQRLEQDMPADGLVHPCRYLMLWGHR